MRHRQPGHESRRGVVGEHDGDEDERPDEEAHREQDPEEQEEFDFLPSTYYQQHIDKGVPEKRKKKKSANGSLFPPCHLAISVSSIDLSNITRKLKNGKKKKIVFRPRIVRVCLSSCPSVIADYFENLIRGGEEIQFYIYTVYTIERVKPSGPNLMEELAERGMKWKEIKTDAADYFFTNAA